MATIKVTNSKSSIKSILNYISLETKTSKELMGSHNCNINTAYKEMTITKKMWHKTGDRTYFHMVQSFHKDDNITLEKAIIIANELVKNNNAFNEFEILFTTHFDKSNIHTHFIINSVNFKTGYKYQMSPKDLQDIKDLSDDLCRKYNLHICEKNKSFDNTNRTEISTFSKNTYYVLKKDEQNKTSNSYINNIASAIINLKLTATSKEDFIQKMYLQGYKVKWEDNLQNLTFMDMNTTSKKNKIGSKKLEQYYNIDFSKEGLLYEFKKNKK